jgi:CheY-like chemotaxis protein
MPCAPAWNPAAGAVRTLREKLHRAAFSCCACKEKTYYPLRFHPDDAPLFDSRVDGFPLTAANDMCSILLVEDHDDTRGVFAKLLRSWGHEVAAANSVSSGLAALADKNVNVILSDLGLPDGSGCDLMTAVRPKNPHILAIAISAYYMAADKERSLAAGFDLHLGKPVDLMRLFNILSAMPPDAGLPEKVIAA